MSRAMATAVRRMTRGFPLAAIGIFGAALLFFRFELQCSWGWSVVGAFVGLIVSALGAVAYVVLGFTASDPFDPSPPAGGS